MAEFIVGSPLRNLARKRPFLRRALWRLDFALLWLLVKLFTLLPVDFASRLGQRVGSWVGPRMARKTALYRENMLIAFPELSEAELAARVREAWGRAGRILAEYPHLATILTEDERLEIEIREAIPAYTDRSRPCVVVTAHVSNWEVVGSAMARLGMPNASLYTPPTNPYLDAMLADSRRALDCELIARDNSARLLMRALRQGRTAAMVMDRRVDEGRPIQFFGHDKLSTLLPAKLALKFDCEMIPVQVQRREDARYRVTFHPPVRPNNPEAGGYASSPRTGSVPSACGIRGSVRPPRICQGTKPV
jgi:KDO2-lipid IV(A) lauroyltransferase